MVKNTVCHVHDFAALVSAVPESNRDKNTMSIVSPTKYVHVHVLTRAKKACITNT
jgi:hypothetical protein